MLNRIECVLREEWGSLSELTMLVEFGSLCYTAVFFFPFPSTSGMLLTTLCPIKYLCYRRSLTADHCAPVVPVLRRSDFERHRPASTGLSACPTETPTGFEPSHGHCRQHCLSKHNLTLWVHQRVIHFDTTVSVLEEKFTFIRGEHKGLLLILCFNFHL